jgi:hypothetical protein
MLWWREAVERSSALSHELGLRVIRDMICPHRPLGSTEIDAHFAVMRTVTSAECPAQRRCDIASSFSVQHADAERYRAGLRVGTALTEATANFLVNRRMNKAQQMRWSRRGADLLQVRCAALNGKLGSGLGQIFKADADLAPDLAMAA